LYKEKIYNLISDPIEGQRKTQVIPFEIQKILDKYSKVILKGDWNIGNYNLVEYEIYLKHDKFIKSPVWYINSKLTDWLKDEF